MHDGNRDYYRMRAKEERRRADIATGSARKTHILLAAKYEDLAAAPREVDPDELETKGEADHGERGASLRSAQHASRNRGGDLRVVLPYPEGFAESANLMCGSTHDGRLAACRHSTHC